MQQHHFGHAGFTVSALGLGAGQVGDHALDETAAAELLNTALDSGITLIDTARGYGSSEERIGRHLAHRRSEYILSTKVGYGVDGLPDWTYDCVTVGIDQALARLNTDVIDIVHLHSCPLPILQNNGVVDALARAREAGKLRVAAYSGENAELGWAVGDARFSSVECSVNVFDQTSLIETLPQATVRGMGIIAKRPLGNAPWRFGERPVGHYAETYWQRMHALALDLAGMPWDVFALRFSAFAPGVSSAIAGTGSVAHLKHNVQIIEQGPLDDTLVQAVMTRYRQIGAAWLGEI